MYTISLWTPTPKHSRPAWSMVTQFNSHPSLQSHMGPTYCRRAIVCCRLCSGSIVLCEYAAYHRPGAFSANWPIIHGTSKTVCNASANCMSMYCQAAPANVFYFGECVCGGGAIVVKKHRNSTKR